MKNANMEKDNRLGNEKLIQKNTEDPGKKKTR